MNTIYIYIGFSINCCMNKGGLWIVILVVISIIGISYSQLSPDLAPRVYSSCITPPAYPGVITQSETICSGTYYDGIEIAGNNINLKCSGAIFAGYSNPNRMNGLLINGSYRNITVEDCIFSVFPENGVSLSGPVGTANPQKLTGVLLKNVTAFGNGGDGLKIKENTYQTDALGGKYDSNGKNGIHLVSEYKDPLRYNINPDLYPKYFPNDVRLFNATMSNNWNNGIHVDAEKYYRQPDDILLEDNILIFDGNRINNNLENGIKNTDFFINITLQNGWSGVEGKYFIARNKIWNNSLAGIKIHTKKTQGPLGTEINCSEIISSGQYSRSKLAISSINYIYWNLIEENKNGIEVTVDSNSTPNSTNSCGGTLPGYASGLYLSIANRIRYNKESGVLYHLMYPFPITGINSDFVTYIGTQDSYYQNIISSNGNSGVFLNGSASVMNDSNAVMRFSSLRLYCNDIIQNRDYGLRITGRNNPLSMEGTINLIIDMQNIIEQNFIGGVYLNYTRHPYLDGIVSVYNSHIGNHPLFDFYNNVYRTSPYNFLEQNDFVASPLLAFDIGNVLNWRNNYWSDYSPTCVDSSPQDGWCDVNRPIPVANQDTQPKAGLPWGNNARGYLPLDQGMTLSQCYVDMPLYPQRPQNPGGGGGNQRDPVEPD